MPLHDIRALSLSPFNDSFVVIHSKRDGFDVVLNLAGNPEAGSATNVAEFVARLYVASRDNAHNKFAVEVTERIQYNNTCAAGRSNTITFRKHPAGVPGATFRNHVVTYA